MRTNESASCSKNFSTENIEKIKVKWEEFSTGNIEKIKVKEKEIITLMCVWIKKTSIKFIIISMIIKSQINYKPQRTKKFRYIEVVFSYFIELSWIEHSNMIIRINSTDGYMNLRQI